jgi:RNA polymerase sigma-70 factor (ECF subfamily)
VSLDDAAIERLVKEAQAGDAWAFGRLFDHFHLPVYRFVASRVRRRSDAEDLTQLVFVKALEALPRYESRGIPFGGWLFRLARNAIIDQIRTRRDHLPLVTALTRETDDSGPEARAALKDDLDRVAQALTELTDDQREVIELRFFAGLSVLETAVAMGRQEGTVRGLQFRAIAALRRTLGIDAAALAGEHSIGPAPTLTVIPVRVRS